MSAWIVSQRHIDCLVTALEDFGLLDCAPTAAGRNLWRENIASVAHRYPEYTRDALPGYPLGRDPKAYRFRVAPWQRTDAAIARLLKAIACYEYQSCEHPTFRESWSWQRLEELRTCLLLCLPEHWQTLQPSPYGDDYEPQAAIYTSALYEQAPWGEDEEE